MTTPQMVHKLTRRELLQCGGWSSVLGLLGLSHSDVLAAANAPRRKDYLRDRAVVFLFLQGGPPQIETFDPKMEASEDVRSCTGAVQTRLPGVWFGGTFPKLAARAHRLAIVRSFGSGFANHEQEPVLNGNSSTKGTIGAHYSWLFGANHSVTGMPTHVVVLPEQIQPDLKLGRPNVPLTLPEIRKVTGAAGSLGPSCEGVLLDGSSNFLGTLSLRVPMERFDNRRNLLKSLEDSRPSIKSSRTLDGYDSLRAQAFQVLSKGIADAFDLSKEDPHVVAQYDTSHLFDMRDYHQGGRHYHDRVNQSRWTNLLGKQMLLARRLVEAGCGFVTVHDACWDFHADGANPPVREGMSVLGPQLDHAVAAFLDDVEQRGLRDKVLLVITGEMGRVPKKDARGGTNHWGELTPLVFAGGGLKMSQVIGETDRSGARPVSRPYAPQHLLATIVQAICHPGEARLDAGLPGEFVQLLDRESAISELFTG